MSLVDVDITRSIPDRLISDSQLYRSSKDYLELLDFINRLPNIAPFNAMLLQIQKPGLKFAMTAKDWRVVQPIPKRRSKTVANNVAVRTRWIPYDEIDTEGSELPIDVRSFVARDPITEIDIERFKKLLRRKKIECELCRCR